MQLITTLLLFISYYTGNIESARDINDRLKVTSSLFAVFDYNFHDTVSNRFRCINLNDQISSLLAPYRNMLVREEMPSKEIEEYFIFFCATSPKYKFRKPNAEWIFSSMFVQYSVIQTIFSLTVCRLYNLYALETPNVQRAEDCAKVVSYLNAFRSIATKDRLLEISKIYGLTADEPSADQALQRLAAENSRGFHTLNMLSVQDKLFQIDELLDRFTDIIGAESSQRVSPLPCEGPPISSRDKSKETAPLQLHLDFYIDANMNDKNVYCSSKSIRDSLTGSQRFHPFSYNEAFRRYYYNEAMKDIFHVFFSNFLPLVNYFKAALFGDSPVGITAGVFEPFIPPIDRSLKIWDKAHELRRIVEVNWRDNRSKVIKILREVLKANANLDAYAPAEIQLTYKSQRSEEESDFYVDFKS